MYNNTCHSRVRVTAKKTQTEQVEPLVEAILWSMLAPFCGRRQTAHNNHTPHIHYKGPRGSPLTLFQHPGTGKPSSPWEHEEQKNGREICPKIGKTRHDHASKKQRGGKTQHCVASLNSFIEMENVCFSYRDPKYLFITIIEVLSDMKYRLYMKGNHFTCHVISQSISV